MPGGRIEGYTHPNETFWCISDHGVELLNDRGETTTIFSECRERPDGRLVLLGKYVGSADGPVHYLTAAPNAVEPARTLEVWGGRPPHPLWFDGHAWRIDVLRHGGLGDALMTAAALRSYKRAFPDVGVYFYTGYASLFDKLPYLDGCAQPDAAPALHTKIQYENLMPSPHHVARLIGYLIGVEVIDTKPECTFDLALVHSFIQAWAHLPRPWVVVQRRASRYTPNKDWPEDYWVKLISMACEIGSVIDIGHGQEGGPGVDHQNYLDLRSQTSFQQLVAVVAAGDVIVGPPSGPVHLAGALDKPIVEIVGGFELPANTNYFRTRAFGTDLPCAPCALLTPCPFDLTCLRQIEPDHVLNAIRECSRGLPLESRELIRKE
jgi:ADP-heptose:LPS heptosyltransferase